ncbi:hypothetical protein [uncultured Roseibium sp.]|uniref:hypothetical protein n=1 Tax=uncultured Roseibium sp. TaxID=1936171 RepID=UPI0026207328|nr:hypothetical protein [uncultured Roseibium sp.]
MADLRTIHAQIEEVQRELDQRARVYPGLVRKGRMRQGQADEHVLRMNCVLKTLEWLRDHQAAIRSAVAQGG